MKETSLILKRKLKELNPSNLLMSGLLGLLLIIYIYTIYAIVITLGTFPFGKLPAYSLLPTSENRLLNLIVLLCIALTIVPVSRWLHRRLNDLVYAQDDNPYALVASINQQLQTMTNPQLTLPPVMETIATMLHLPYLCLELNHPELPTQVEFGSKTSRTKMRHFPVSYLEQSLGMLLVAERSANRSLSGNDQVILQDIAQQIGIALTVTRLTADLQTSRERLVIAREEERRRIRRDLHDGLGPTLASLRMQLGAVRRFVRNNPAQAELLIDELRGDLSTATAEIRRLVDDLRPPMLDELGLIAAIKNLKLTDFSIQLEVIAPEPMPQLSAAVEVAVYRIASEAIHNVVKHALAENCVVEVQVEISQLTLRVTDDGHYMSAGLTNGIGLQTMQERAAELGGTFSIQPAKAGGTRIVVHLPLES